MGYDGFTKMGVEMHIYTKLTQFVLFLEINMKTSVIIMAEGSGDRWKHRERFVSPVSHKQLLPINGIPLIERTIIQANAYDLGNVTLICPDCFRDVMATDVAMMSLGYKKGNDRSILDGILKTQLLWDDRTIILLGDVCFSHKSIRFLSEAALDCFLLGRKGANPVTGKSAGELFALSFLEHRQNEIVRSLYIALNSDGKKLWDLLNELPMTIYETCDYSDDTDSPEAYIMFWAKLRDAAIKDDKEK